MKLTERGAIEVDDRLHTSADNIWAIGDVRGGLQFTYLSLDDYRIIRDELFGDGKRNTGDREAVAYSVFIDPPLSHVGLNEEQALRTGRNIKVSKVMAASMPRTRTIGQPEGLLKTAWMPTRTRYWELRCSVPSRVKSSTSCRWRCVRIMIMSSFVTIFSLTLL